MSRFVATDGGSVMVDRSTPQGCCSSADLSKNLAERAELGRRRLLKVRRLAAWSSVTLAALSVLGFLHVLPVDSGVSERLAVAAALFGLPRLLGHLRQALVARRPNPPAVVGSALAVAALFGLAPVVAAVVATVLVGDLRRQLREDRCAVRQAAPAAQLTRVG